MSKNRTPASRAVDFVRVDEQREDPMDDDARSSASAGRASRAWSMNESVESGDANELATIRVRTMYGCVFQQFPGRARLLPPPCLNALRNTTQCLSLELDQG